jgi:hypothetical protein
MNRTEWTAPSRRERERAPVANPEAREPDEYAMGGCVKRLRLLLAGTSVLVATAALSPTASETQGAGAKPVDDPEAYAVYASLLPTEWTVRVAHAKTVVFQRETVTNWTCMPAGKPLETDWKPVVDSFRAENAGVRPLVAGFPLGIPYVVVPEAEIKASSQQVPGDPMSGWTGFYKRYPDAGGSIMVVSAVGFDAAKRRAMVYMAHSCGLLCGGGAHHLLEKVDGVWRQAELAGVTSCVWWS